ncbi:hypothetical protein [Bradyrhizobium genosp. P]|uniref:hypothetical protein n=1 Tax=Bradyrhizobium genosp. P TaxID=83641 RepID=UPI003CE94710
MFGALSVVCVGMGSVLAYGARWCRSRTEILETGAGWLLVAGLGLLGSALPHVS